MRPCSRRLSISALRWLRRGQHRQAKHRRPVLFLVLVVILGALLGVSATLTTMPPSSLAALGSVVALTARHGRRADHCGNGRELANGNTIQIAGVSVRLDDIETYPRP
jgi:hypothetical protein